MRISKTTISVLAFVWGVCAATDAAQAQPGGILLHQKAGDTEDGFTGVLIGNDFFGRSVASLGDLDGDGMGDLAVGAELDSDGGHARAHQIVQDVGIPEEYRRRYEAIRSGLIEVDSAGSLQPPGAKLSANGAASNRIWSGAPLVLFGSTGGQGGMLITIDPVTGAGTAVVPHGAFGPVSDIDCSPASLMYGGTGGGSGNLITIDPASVPAESLVGANGLGPSANIALEWVDSTLYGIVIFSGGGGSMSDLVTLDPNTGLATTVGPTGMGPIGGLAYDPNAGVMYGTQSGGQSAGNFVTVDLNTGAATIVGPTGFADVAALDFDPSSGILYGGIGGSDPNAGSLITIDPSTGAGTLVGPTGFPVLSGVTFCGAPSGACCVVGTEICTDDQAEEECDAQGGEWHVGQSCGDILCSPPPVEACGGANESFETGDFSGWLTQDLSNPFFALRVDGAGISPGFGLFSSAPTDGLFAALHGFDGNGPGTITVAQDFDLPAGATALEFDYRGGWVLTFGATQDRTFEVTLRPAGGGAPFEPPQLILTALAGTVVPDTGNLVGSIDVSAYAGSTVQVSFEWFVPENFTGPAFFQMDNIRCLVPLEQRSLDIKPGSCPNPFNRHGNGVLPVALVGTVEFDPAEVDLSTLQLSRADGVGGSVAPNEGPPGPHSVLEDAATPFDGEGCECHDLGGDGIDDLSMKFKTRDLVDALELDDLSGGAMVELVLSGSLLDGTTFVASDCIVIVPPGDTSPANAHVQSNVVDTFVDVAPLDLNFDGDGFADFARSYYSGTVLTLTAPLHSADRRFVRWSVDGVLQEVGVRTLELVVDQDVNLRAVYEHDRRPRPDRPMEGDGSVE